LPLPLLDGAAVSSQFERYVDGLTALPDAGPISESAVNLYISNAKHKLGAKTREQAVARAIFSGEINIQRVARRAPAAGRRADNVRDGRSKDGPENPCASRRCFPRRSAGALRQNGNHRRSIRRTNGAGRSWETSAGRCRSSG
jgi:hypothetical protein